MSGSPDQGSQTNYLTRVTQELDKRVNALENAAAQEMNTVQQWLAKHTYAIVGVVFVLGVIVGHIWR